MFIVRLSPCLKYDRIFFASISKIDYKDMAGIHVMSLNLSSLNVIYSFQWTNIAAIQDYLSFEFIPILFDMIMLD